MVCSAENNKNMWSGTDQITWSKYVVGAENRTAFLSPQVLYCNLELRLCQVLFSINSVLKIWYAVNKEKPRRDHFRHQDANPSVHTWWRWSHFAFRRIKTPVKTQKLIYSKQRKGDHSGNHRRWSRYIGTYVCKLKHGFANFEKIKRSLKKLSLNACNLSKKVIQW